MGMPSSKFGKEIPKNELQEGSVPSTPILTPKTIKLSEMDPRSPSLHIARTPLELLSAAASKLELFSDKDTPVKNNLILGVDPRSPTTDFKRTPIIINATESDFPRKLHNKNLDKVLQTELYTSPIQDILKNLPSVIPPKLLQSSPIKRRSDAYKRRSLVGLLETNIDYTETNLDIIMQEKCKVGNTEESILETEENAITEVEVCGQQNNFNDNPQTDKAHELFNDVRLSENILEQPEIIVEMVHGAEAKIDNYEQTEPDSQVENIEDQLDEFPNQTKSAPVTPPNIPLSPILPFKEIKSAPASPPLVNLAADVKELDKKLTNLIYEDDLVVCPRIVKLKDTTERSPLRNCNGNETRAKSAQKLKVSDKPRRSEYAVSKIPVFKDKKGKIKKEIQCENTPPRNMEKMKIRHRMTDWDTKDSTLYL